MDKEKALENQGSKFREDIAMGGGAFLIETENENVTLTLSGNDSYDS